MAPIQMSSTSWGSGTPIDGTPFRQAVTTAATEGRLVILTVDMAPGVHVDEHLHEGEDQITIVISGSVGARVGTKELQLTDGSIAFLPRGIPHSQWNSGDGFARVIEIYTPGGFEEVFARAGKANKGHEAGGADYTAARNLAG
jgi:quercetin dioxygenase-like cupin family protein